MSGSAHHPYPGALIPQFDHAIRTGELPNTVSRSRWRVSCRAVCRDVEFMHDQLLRCRLDKPRRSNRESFNEHAFGDRLFFDRGKVKVDCLPDMPPSVFRSIPYRNATRNGWYVSGVTALIGWYAHDFEFLCRSCFNGAAVRMVLRTLVLARQ